MAASIPPSVESRLANLEQQLQEIRARLVVIERLLSNPRRAPGRPIDGAKESHLRLAGVTPSPTGIGGARRRVAEILERFPTGSPAASTAGAAVMGVLRERHHDVEILLIERAHREGDPASGQVSLPGGHVDPADPDLRATALRELEEEVGLRRSDLVEPVPLRRNDRSEAASPFRSECSARNSPRRPGCRRTATPGRSPAIFWLPYDALGHPVPMILPTPQGPLELPSVHHEGHVVWGFTLRVLGELFAGPAHRSPGVP